MGWADESESSDDDFVDATGTTTLQNAPARVYHRTDGGTNGSGAAVRAQVKKPPRRHDVDTPPRRLGAVRDGPGRRESPRYAQSGDDSFEDASAIQGISRGQGGRQSQFGGREGVNASAASDDAWNDWSGTDSDATVVDRRAGGSSRGHNGPSSGRDRGGNMSMEALFAMDSGSAVRGSPGSGGSRGSGGKTGKEGKKNGHDPGTKRTPQDGRVWEGNTGEFDTAMSGVSGLSGGSDSGGSIVEGSGDGGGSMGGERHLGSSGLRRSVSLVGSEMGKATTGTESTTTTSGTSGGLATARATAFRHKPAPPLIEDDSGEVEALHVPKQLHTPRSPSANSGGGDGGLHQNGGMEDEHTGVPTPRKRSRMSKVRGFLLRHRPWWSVSKPVYGTGRNALEVVAVRKDHVELSDLHVLQNMSAHGGPVWAMEFSHDGSLLATGGHDHVVRLWAVRSCVCRGIGLASRLHDRYGTRGPGGAGRGGGLALAAEVERGYVLNRPIREFEGHSSDILDLSWSVRESLLLSASSDCTVRLWHPEREACLYIFRHSDFVTSVEFHPVDESLFVTTAVDCFIRVWNLRVRPARVAVFRQTRDCLTAVAFDRTGHRCLAGTAYGEVLIFDFDEDSMHYCRTIHVRSKRGKSREGSKITGIVMHPSKQHAVVSSNDSRVRIYDIGTGALVGKYNGGLNLGSTIRASLDWFGDRIVIGGEDASVVLWNIAATGSRRELDHMYAELVKARGEFGGNAAQHAMSGSSCGAIGMLCKRHRQSGRRIRCRQYEQFLDFDSVVLATLMPKFKDTGELVNRVDLNGQVIVTSDVAGTINFFVNCAGKRDLATQ